MPLHLGNSTIETIGSYEALAAQPGVLQAVSVVQEPTKLEYITGETIDPAGLILSITIDGNTYQIGPEGTGDGTDKYIKVDATMGGAILDASEYTGVTVQPWVSLNNNEVQSSNGFFISIADGPAVDTVLENNSWETIAQIAAAGKAQEYWNIGDSKVLSAGGENLVVKIMGFNHYYLSHTDSRYGTTYNNSSNKTAITFMATTIPSTDRRWYSSDTTLKVHYGTSDIGNYVNTTLLNSFPFEASLVPIVQLGYQGSNTTFSSTSSSSIITYSDDNKYQVFLPGQLEVSASGYNAVSGLNAIETEFTFFANGNTTAFANANGTTLDNVYDGPQLRDLGFKSNDTKPGITRLVYRNSTNSVSSSGMAQNSTCKYTIVFNL